ncbi:MAG: SNF2 family helicase, partial [Verrucomicrobiales bacterium]|nr:SNF2 family helicase [Verrucomicrobiales bacterium]
VSAVELTESFLAKIAGWEAIKHARAMLAQGNVLSSNWTPPVLKGVVEEGSISYRAGLILKDTINIENLCSCRASRQWGTICAHSVAVGLHQLSNGKPTSASPPAAKTSALSHSTSSNSSARAQSSSVKLGKRLQRSNDFGAEPLEIFVIIPPSFEQALAKGKAMLCFEGRWAKSRSPLNALPRTTPFKLSEQDSALLNRIEELAGGETPAMLLVSAGVFAGLLQELRDHPRVSLGKAQSVAISSEPYKLSLQLILQTSGEITVRWQPGPIMPTLIMGDRSWAFAGVQFQPCALPKKFHEVLRGPLTIPRSEVPAFLSCDWPLLQAACAIAANFTLADFVLEPQPPRFFLHLAGGMARLEAQLQCAYGPRIMTVGVTAKDESLWLPDPDSPTRYSTRDLASEQNALRRLSRYGFTGPDTNGRYLLAGQNQVLTFFAREFPKLEREWKVTLEERLERSTSQHIERIEPNLQVTPSGEQWFDLDVSFSSTGGERFSAAEIQRLVLGGQSHTRLKNGKFAVIDTGAVEELQEVLLDCAPQQHQAGYRLRNIQAGFLEATLREKTHWHVQAPAAWREQAAQRRGEAKLEPPPLGELENVLRPYQKHGVAWLQFLRENHFGGILADEMGLGKTLQALAFMRAMRSAECGARNAEPAPSSCATSRQDLAEGVSAAGAHTPHSALRIPHLVVCPTSLVFNWVEEARKFTPKMRVLALQGPRRHELFEKINDADLVLTSYALMRRDGDAYRAYEFDTVVLDEAQHIKNRQTQNAQAVKAIRARHRLVLTGTPMENSVLDLWSIFDFLMPGYLGSAQDFRERYEVPIVRDKNVEVQARLARRIRPFLLRRLKREVATDLPEKIEQISFCELTEDQRAVYQQVLEAGRKEVLATAGQQGLQKSRMAVLNALLRLRQICCDPRLLKLENVDARTASGKLDLFGELLEEVIDGGHRVLVFSQFVTMLKLLEERLRAEEIAYCYLDGSTANRAEVVERFQKNDEIPVFLISLKAGGVGLNLTGADTVIHFDPWWNPAVEAQATDRTHRIGQTRVVTSYKLITRGTVEEKILTLQGRKREIVSRTLAGEEEFTNMLSWEEIQDLLSGD